VSFPEQVLKEGGALIVNDIHHAINEYKAIRNIVLEKCGDEVWIKPINSVKEFGHPTPDLCDATPNFIRRLNLLVESEKGTLRF
jgi:hypothetical protein